MALGVLKGRYSACGLDALSDIRHCRYFLAAECLSQDVPFSQNTCATNVPSSDGISG